MVWAPKFQTEKFAGRGHFERFRGSLCLRRTGFFIRQLKILISDQSQGDDRVGEGVRQGNWLGEAATDFDRVRDYLAVEPGDRFRGVYEQNHPIFYRTLVFYNAGDEWMSSEADRSDWKLEWDGS